MLLYRRRRVAGGSVLGSYQEAHGGRKAGVSPCTKGAGARSACGIRFATGAASTAPTEGSAVPVLAHAAVALEAARPPPPRAGRCQPRWRASIHYSPLDEEGRVSARCAVARPPRRVARG